MSYLLLRLLGLRLGLRRSVDAIEVLGLSPMNAVALPTEKPIVHKDLVRRLEELHVLLIAFRDAQRGGDVLVHVLKTTGNLVVRAF